MQPKTLILASGSRYKRRLLERLQISFDSHDADIDEQRRHEEAPSQLALRLAEEKARAIRPAFPDAYLLGADQVIALRDQIFHKPHTIAAACDQLRTLAGHSHSLHTAMALVSPDDQLFTALVSYQMEMRPLSEEVIQAYVQEDRPLDCAGSYKIEAGGIRLFRNTIGPDPTAIEGLALTRIQDLLEASGFFS